MKRFSEQLYQKAQTVKLKAAEHAELRERVVSYMEYHPLPEVAKRTIPKGERALFTEPYRALSFNAWRFSQFFGVAVCVLAITVSWSAENAVPGDALYAIKVRFNEEVRSTFTFTPYEKITWETERLSRRIAEARVLAGEGRLTDEVEASVAAAVRTHGENARRGIAELKETDRDEAGLASLYLATTLDVQSVALRGGAEAADATLMATGMAVDGASTHDLIADVVAEERSQTDVPDVDALPSYERLLAHVETDTTRARELLAAITKVATLEEQRDITRRLEDADRVMARALELSAEKPDESRPLLLEVLQRTQKLIVFMTNIDVRAAVAVEVLVPVELTSEERSVAAQDAVSRTETLVALITTALPATTLPTDVNDKVVTALETIEILLSEARTALSGGEGARAEGPAYEALALAEDSARIIGLTPETTVIPEPPVNDDSTPTTTPPVDDSVSTSTPTSTSTETVASTTEEI